MVLVGWIDGCLSSDDICPNNMNNGEVDSGEHTCGSSDIFLRRCLIQRRWESLSRCTSESMFGCFPVMISGCDPAAADNATQTPKNTPHQPIWLLDSGAAFHATGDSGIFRNNMNNGEVDGGEHISVHSYMCSKMVEYLQLWERRVMAFLSPMREDLFKQPHDDEAKAKRTWHDHIILQKYKNKLKHYEDICKGNREMAIDVHPLFVDSGAGLSSVSGCDPAAADNATQTPKNTPHQPIWLIDSGAAFHATGDQSLLADFTPLPGDHTIRVPHKGRMQVHGIGSVNAPNVVLQNVRYVPDLGTNLISVGQLAKLGYKVSTGDYGCRISKGSDDNVVGKARFTDDFQFEVEFVKVPPSAN